MRINYLILAGALSGCRKDDSSGTKGTNPDPKSEIENKEAIKHISGGGAIHSGVIPGEDHPEAGYEQRESPANSAVERLSKDIAEFQKKRLTAASELEASYGKLIEDMEGGMKKIDSLSLEPEPRMVKTSTKSTRVSPRMTQNSGRPPVRTRRQTKPKRTVDEILQEFKESAGDSNEDYMSALIEISNFDLSPSDKVLANDKLLAVQRDKSVLRSKALTGEQEKLVREIVAEHKSGERFYLNAFAKIKAIPDLSVLGQAAAMDILKETAAVKPEREDWAESMNSRLTAAAFKASEIIESFKGDDTFRNAAGLNRAHLSARESLRVIGLTQAMTNEALGELRRINEGKKKEMSPSGPNEEKADTAGGSPQISNKPIPIQEKKKLAQEIIEEVARAVDVDKARNEALLAIDQLGLGDLDKQRVLTSLKKVYEETRKVRSMEAVEPIINSMTPEIKIQERGLSPALEKIALERLENGPIPAGIQKPTTKAGLKAEMEPGKASMSVNGFKGLALMDLSDALIDKSAAETIAQLEALKTLPATVGEEVETLAFASKPVTPPQGERSQASNALGLSAGTTDEEGEEEDDDSSGDEEEALRSSEVEEAVALPEGIVAQFEMKGTTDSYEEARKRVKKLDAFTSLGENSLSDCIPEGQEFIRLVGWDGPVSVKKFSISLAPDKLTTEIAKQMDSDLLDPLPVLDHHNEECRDRVILGSKFGASMREAWEKPYAMQRDAVMNFARVVLEGI